MKERAASFVAAALAGLCAQSRARDAKTTAAEAIEIGVEAAKQFEAFADTSRGIHLGFHNVTMGDMSEERVREIFSKMLADALGSEAPPEG